MPKLSVVLGVSALVITAFAAGFVLSKRYEDDFEFRYDEQEEPESADPVEEVPTVTDVPEELVNKPYTSKYFDSPEEAAEALIPGHNANDVVVPREERKQYMRRVFEYIPPSTDDRTVYETLLSERELDENFSQGTSREPRVISVDECFNDESDVQTFTLTWYEGDRVLVDSDEDVFEDVDEAIGYNNLRFGERSNDANVVYVHNPTFNLNYEIVRHPGTYKTDVLGLD